MELPNNISINRYVIELVEGKQLSYRPIYSLSLVELETFKRFINSYRKQGFVRPFKSLAEAPILFETKV